MLGRFAGSRGRGRRRAGGRQRPAFEMLPTLGYQYPDYTLFRSSNIHTGLAGSTFTDPASGLVVRKLTDSTTNNSSVTLIYGDCGPHISARHSGNLHTIVAWDLNNADTLLDYNSETGAVVNRRARPLGMATNMRCGFSRNLDTPSILYYLTSTSRVVRWDVSINAESPNALFPSGGFVVSPTFTVGSEGWFQVAFDGTHDVLCWHDAAVDRVFWLHTGTGLLRTRIFTDYNEPHLDKAGRYVFKQGAPFDIWDTTTDTMITASGTTQDVHPCTVNGYLVGQHPASGLFPVEILQPNGSRITHSQAGDLDHMVASHSYANWVQTATDLTQWFGGKAETSQNELSCYKPSSWTLDSGNVYYATITLWGGYQENSRRPCNFVVQTNPSDQYEIIHTLTSVSNRVSMVERSSYFDTATNRLYVWVPGGGSPGSTIMAWSTFPNVQGAAFARLDSTLSVKGPCAYNFIWDNLADYWERNWTQVSVDGRVVVWGSNMGKSLRSPNSPRIDLFAANLPMV